jgi:hypothetical protein
MIIRFITAVVRRPGELPRRAAAFTVTAVLAATSVAAAPFPTTREDFELPGTQPLTVTDNFSLPSACTPCHSNYGQPNVEPFRAWRGSMMAQSGRDPLMLAALAIANQDAEHSGETCLRCHLPKGWLEGRSAPEDGTAMTAGDREGVQCTVCHRMVDPFAAPENPPEDAAILAGLAAPVPSLGSAMFVMDPQERLRGPFDIIDDLGSDPHLPTRSTLVSPFHSSSDLCGVCHNVTNPIFTRNMAGEYELNALDTPGDPTLGFPEQSTYDEWAASTFATTGVHAPQFGGNKAVVSTCQDCHMPDVTGRDASFGLLRTDVPLHEMVGGNTFIPKVLPHHPAFGGDVDAALLAATVDKATVMLRRAARMSLSLVNGDLTVRVTNESGHKLPTGYPDGRRMWLHVRAFDENRAVVFESGRYVFSTGELVGYGSGPGDLDYDPHLQVWETIHGISPALAVTLGVPPGPSFHLVLNNVREKDNRIPPLGFTNAAYEAFSGEPVGEAFADGQNFDEVVYPVGPQVVQAEATLYYQTASRDYVEFLRDENVTNAAGNILYDLWEQHDKSTPVAMAQGFFESDRSVVERCHKSIAKEQERYTKLYMKEWDKCFAAEVRGLTCSAAKRDAKIAAAMAKLRDKIGGAKDRRCAGASLTPISLGHGTSCPEPCADVPVFDMNGLASCALCTAQAVGDAGLVSAYGADPPVLPSHNPTGPAASCQRALAKASRGLAVEWARADAGCAFDDLTVPANCDDDPTGDVARAQDKAGAKIASCTDFTGLAGCGATGSTAAAEQCVFDAFGDVIPDYTRVAFPER